MRLGAMIRRVFGNQNSGNALAESLNKQISKLTLEDAALRFTFTDGTKIQLTDMGQSCCESRYMRTDDDPSYYVGAILLDAEIKEVPNGPDESYIGGEHEVQFLEIKTDKGSFTCACHNEHNGYYGGFAIEASKIE